MSTAIATSFILSDTDRQLLASLPDTVRDETLEKLDAMEQISRARSARQGAMAVAAQHPHRRGWSAFRLGRLYSAFQEDGLIALVDRARAGAAFYQNRMHSVGLPEAFVEFLAEEWALHQRDKFKAVRRRLIRRWESWRRDGGSANSKYAIPGYDTAPEMEPGYNYPAGWSYGNLLAQTKKASDKWSRKQVQIGPKAAAELGPRILSTRVGTEVGQYWIFDDSWNDFEVIWRGRPVRQLAFHALDFTSGLNAMRGYKPAAENDRGATEGLKEREMIFLVAALFATEGFHPAGCTCICEKATATIGDREAKLLYDLSGRKIKVDTGPAGGGPGVGGLFTGPGGGNPRWKAPLESWFNLLRNETAHLLDFPAQTGSNSRLNKPEGLEALKAETRALGTAALALPDDVAQLMKFGMLSHEEAMFRCDGIVELINQRTDHALEGWRKCGHVLTEFRIHETLPWMPARKLLEMPAAKAAAVRAVAQTRERPLSPREVYNAGRRKLVRISPEATAMLLADLPGKERPVEGGQLVLPVPEVDRDEPLVYGLRRRNGQGIEEPLRNGDKYLVRVNPLMPEVAFLYDARNAYAGVVERWGRTQRPDTAGLEAQRKAKSKALQAPLAEARRVGAKLTRDRAERDEHNRRLIENIRRGDVKELSHDLVAVEDNTDEWLERAGE